MGVATELEQRVLDAVDGQRESYEAAGYEGPMPLHGEAGGAKWRVNAGDSELPAWEGGYVCHCWQVFARSVAEGGMPAANGALAEHVREVRS